jgi:Uma2 family endonuclease
MSTATTDPRSTVALPETSNVAGEERHVMRGATWRFYDWLTDALGERAPFRVAYDGKDIEIMTLGPKHERSKNLLGLFIDHVATGLEIDCEELGSTTWKRPGLGRGIESDLCYCFEPAKIEACEAADSRDSNDVADYPNPDLAVEVDLSLPKIDRPAIYRELRVAEIWRLRAGIVSIEQLGVDGNYVAAESSRFLHVTPEEVTRWVVKEKSGNRRQWKMRLRKWILTELKPRVDNDRLGTSMEIDAAE